MRILHGRFRDVADRILHRRNAKNRAKWPSRRSTETSAAAQVTNRSNARPSRSVGQLVSGVGGQKNLRRKFRRRKRNRSRIFFRKSKNRLVELKQQPIRQSKIQNPQIIFVGGGTDLYVQRPEEMVHAPAENLFDNSDLRKIEENGDFIEIGASVDRHGFARIARLCKSIFPNLYKHLKLVSSTPIRNMATLAGNFVNASPIGDMTAWFLALDARLSSTPGAKLPLARALSRLQNAGQNGRRIHHQNSFSKRFQHFNFEKVSKRTYLDISSVNTAISLKIGKRFDNRKRTFRPAASRRFLCI